MSSKGRCRGPRVGRAKKRRKAELTAAGCEYARKVDVEIRERAQGAAGGRKVLKKGVRRRVFDSKEFSDAQEDPALES